MKKYDRTKAVEYARKHALNHNPRYYYFGGIGGDCTNFMSQCIYAGCEVMNYKKYLGWYYNNVNDRAPSWTSVNFFSRFMLNNKESGPFAKEINLRDVEIGDVIQLRQADTFNHSLIVTKILPNELLVCAHSNDALDRPFSSYGYLEIKCLHILGANY